MNKIPNILKDLRKNQNLTQFQLSQALKIGQATIAGYENGSREPHINSLIAYANFFECSVDYLLGRKAAPAFRFLSSIKVGSCIKEVASFGDSLYIIALRKNYVKCFFIFFKIFEIFLKHSTKNTMNA